MDPDTTLQEMVAAKRSGDTAEMREKAGYLSEWMARGGYRPKGLDMFLRVLQTDIALSYDTNPSADEIPREAYRETLSMFAHPEGMTP